MNNLRFYWNGIKGNDGKLQRCWFGAGPWIKLTPGTIGIYKRDHLPFSAEVRSCFEVQNESCPLTDYFEKDRIYVAPDNPMFPVVAEALAMQDARNAKRFAA